MRKKLVYQTPSTEIIDQVLSSPLCQSGVDVLAIGGGSGNGLNDLEKVDW